MNNLITLGLYTGKTTPDAFAPNLLLMAENLIYRGQWGGFLWESSCRVDSNRNVLIENFLNHTRSDNLLIVDNDVSHPVDAPYMLAARNLPIVSGLYFSRRNGDYQPVLFRSKGTEKYSRAGYGSVIGENFESLAPEVADFFNKYGWPISNAPVSIRNEDNTLLEDSLLSIDAGGFGCLMLSREMLQSMDPPYLLDSISNNGDLNFYRKVKKSGFPIFADLSVICSHMGTEEIGANGFKIFAGGNM